MGFQISYFLERYDLENVHECNLVLIFFGQILVAICQKLSEYLAPQTL